MAQPLSEAEQEETIQARTLSGLSFLAGIWLIAAPFVLSYQTSTAYWSEISAGSLVVLLSLYRLVKPLKAWAGNVMGISGLWLIISPFFLGYITSQAYWNQIIFGIVTALIGFGTGRHLTPSRYRDRSHA